MTTFHSLPPELVDEILRSDEFSIKDLAQCCLVSQQFLPSARRSLYSHVTLQLKPNKEKDLYLLDQPSSKLLATIRQNPSLGRCCVCLHVERREALYQFLPFAERTPIGLIDEWFRLLPNLRMLSTPGFAHDRFRPSTLSQLGGEKWTALDLDICCSDYEFKDLPEARTFEKLRCRDFEVFGGHDRIVFPSSVVTLDLRPASRRLLQGGISTFATLHPPSNSQLRNLRIRLSPTKIAHLADFSYLEYLSLHGIHGFSQDLSSLVSLTRLRRLRRLRLDIKAFPAVQKSLQVLLFNLPRSIYRLDFSRDVPFTVLARLLEPGNPGSFSQLGLPKSVTDYSQGGELDHLRELCAGRGIDIIYFGKKDPIFDL